jgi:hypothetical protein
MIGVTVSFAPAPATIDHLQTLNFAGGRLFHNTTTNKQIP